MGCEELPFLLIWATKSSWSSPDTCFTSCGSWKLPGNNGFSLSDKTVSKLFNQDTLTIYSCVILLLRGELRMNKDSIVSSIEFFFVTGHTLLWLVTRSADWSHIQLISHTRMTKYGRGMIWWRYCKLILSPGYVVVSKQQLQGLLILTVDFFTH